MKIFKTIISLLILLTTTSCGSQAEDCGESCTRLPANSVDSALDVNSASQDGYYLENFTITASAGDIITVHAESYDSIIHLKLYQGDTLIQDGDTQAYYTYPGPNYPNFWIDSLLVTADNTGDYTITVTTTEAAEEYMEETENYTAPTTTGDFTLDWTIGAEEQRECSAADCDIVI